MDIRISDTVMNVSSSYSVRSSNISRENADNNSTETIREMGARVSAENSPVYLIDISSQGRAALESLQRSSQAAQNVSTGANSTSSLFENVAQSENDENSFLFADTESADTGYAYSIDYTAASADEAEETQTAEETEDTEESSLQSESVYSESAASNMVSYTSTESESVSATEAGGSDGTDTVTTSTESNPMNLSMYSEVELRQLLRENVITRSELNSELDSRTESTQQPNEGMQQAIAAYSYQMSFSSGQLSFS